MPTKKKDSHEPQEYIYLTALPIRIWHWVNALGMVTLIATGLQIRFPDVINIFGTYKAAIRLHNTAGITVSLFYLLWFGYYIYKKQLIALYVPNLQELKEGIIKQSFHYFYYYFLGKQSPYHGTPENKFNPMQKTAYLAIMLIFLPAVILTGLVILNIAPLRPLIALFGGIKILVGLHFLLACVFFAFVLSHIYLATLGTTPLAYFKPMWDGWEKKDH